MVCESLRNSHSFQNPIDHTQTNRDMKREHHRTLPPPNQTAYGAVGSSSAGKGKMWEENDDELLAVLGYNV